MSPDNGNRENADSSDMEMTNLDYSSGSEFIPHSEDEDSDDHVSGSSDSEILEVTPSVPYLNTFLQKHLRTKASTSNSQSTTVAASEIVTSGSMIKVNKQLTDRQETNLLPGISEDIHLQETASNIVVMSTTNAKNKRNWDKKNYCYFCEIPQAKLPRHLESQHGTEPEILKLGQAHNKVERANQLCKLRNLGNHKHNCEVRRKNEGTLIVAYRPTEEYVDPSKYSPCPYCYGYYVSRDLWKHKCSIRPPKDCPETSDTTDGGIETRQPKERVAAKSRLLLPPPPGISHELNRLLSAMMPDNVSRVVKSDSLILDLAKRQYMKHGHDLDQHDSIRSKLRELGRLLIELRQLENDANATLQSFIDPTRISAMISAVHAVAGFDESTHTYKTPSLALKIGHSLQKCALIVKANAIESGNKAAAEKAEDFAQVSSMRWETEVSTHAHRTLYQGKRNNPEVLPTSADVVKMSEYLQETRGNCMQDMRDDANDERAAWSSLNEITLTQVIMFNRRRQGEVSKMKTVDFEKRQKTKVDDMSGLSKLEQSLCKMFDVVEVVGKKGRTVPVLLTSNMVESICMLLSKWIDIGIPPENPYVFARPCCQSMGHIRGSDCLNKLSSLAELQHPENMRSTKLRKQIATASQILALKDNELEFLADTMGHDLRVHKRYYQLPDNVRRVAKLSKLFLAMEKGILHKQQGKSLDNLDISEIDGK